MNIDEWLMNNLGESIVMQLFERLKMTYCTLFFDHFFNSPLLIDKLFEDGVYSIGEALSNWKQILDWRKIRKWLGVSRGESDFRYSKNIICRKWCDNKPVLLLATNVDEMSGASNVMRQRKGFQQPKHLFLDLTSLIFTTVIWSRYNGSKNRCLPTRS